MNTLASANNESSEMGRILLVEDNAGDAVYLTAVLEQNVGLRLEVLHCTRLDVSIQHLNDEIFDLVILDLGLPDSQHLDTLRRMLVACGNIPVFILTGSEDMELSKEAIRIGAQECLSKSNISGSFLFRIVCNAIERFRMLLSDPKRIHTDAMTGLLNRFGLLTASTVFCESIGTLGLQGRLLYADIEGLKSINDRLGHDQGDLAIRETATLLRKVFCESDLLCRLGRDKFVVLAFGKEGQPIDPLWKIQSALDGRNTQKGHGYPLSIRFASVDIRNDQPFVLNSMIQKAEEQMRAMKGPQLPRNH
jgi:two-component system, cell cycle response regulator